MPAPTPNNNKPHRVIIIGAGISGLLLAQYLRKCSIPFAIFERDTDSHTRGVGWGLTLHWSLPALRSLLPSELVDRLPETYVDREAVQRGEVSTFPFYDLATGDLKGKSPPAPESQRIRVTREKFRRLLAEGIEIQWGRNYKGYEISIDEAGEAVVTVNFEDGTSCSGSLLAGCDGGRSRVRRDLLPGSEKALHKIPVGVLGVKVEYTQERIQPLRELDPFFFQGTSSENDTFVYFSMLDAPGNSTTNPKGYGNYTCQIVVSWPLRPGFFGRESITHCPATNEDRRELIRAFAQTWAEPFKSLVLDIPPGTDFKPVDLYDWPPPLSLELKDHPVTLMGDAFHPMAMYRGEGANHAILDVLDFAEIVFPESRETMDVAARKNSPSDGPGSPQDTSAFFESELLPARLREYTDKVGERTRPAVLASRRACMDAHNYKKITPTSPLVSRRAMRVEFEDETLGWDY